MSEFVFQAIIDRLRLFGVPIVEEPENKGEPLPFEETCSPTP